MCPPIMTYTHKINKITLFKIFSNTIEINRVSQKNSSLRFLECLYIFKKCWYCYCAWFYFGSRSAPRPATKTNLLSLQSQPASLNKGPADTTMSSQLILIIQYPRLTFKQKPFIANTKAREKLKPGLLVL